MSVLIKSMEMPKRCLDCPFMVSRDNDDCILQTEVENELARTWEELKASCPLIELPPHGRLIDADKLSNQKYENIWTNRLVIDADDLNDASTVIEAERETYGR